MKKGQTNEIPIFKTPRLILKELRLEDVPSYSNHFVEYEVIRNLSAAVPWPYPINGVLEYFQAVIIPEQGISRWSWGIFEKGNLTELIGSISLWTPGVPEHRGFWLGKKYWNRGYMTESVYPINDFAFEQLELKELIFANASKNSASRKIKEKTGCSFLKERPGNFVDPEFTTQQLWILNKESWEKHKMSNPMDYVKLPA